MTSSTPKIAPADGRLGVLVVGLGAVSTTLIAGVELAKRGMGQPFGSMTQMGTIRLGKRTEGRSPLVKDFVPLARLEDIEWGTWDVFPDDAYVAASRAGVLEGGKHIEAISDTLRDIRPMPAAFERKYARNLDGDHTKGDISKRAMLEAIRADINKFRDDKKVDRMVMIWCASTEVFIEPGPAHMTIESFEKAIDANDESIAPSMLYAYAALLEGVPFANGAPNLAVDMPCLRQYATEHNIPISGKDFKTGQTLMKTVLAPMLKARQLGLCWVIVTAKCLMRPRTSRPKKNQSSAYLNTSLSRRKTLSFTVTCSTR
jgi:myo-inositol-1-phosphate synthase